MLTLHPEDQDKLRRHLFDHFVRPHLGREGVDLLKFKSICEAIDALGIDEATLKERFKS